MHKYTFIFIVLFSVPAFAARVSVGPTENGGQYFEIEGCSTFENVTNNIEGYKSIPEMSYENRIVICDNNRYESKDMMGILKQVAEKALKKECFKVDIDDANKTIQFTYLKGNKKITRYNISSDTYTVNDDDKNPYVEMDQSTKITHLCVLDEENMDELYVKILGNQ